MVILGTVGDQAQSGSVETVLKKRLSSKDYIDWKYSGCEGLQRISMKCEPDGEVSSLEFTFGRPEIKFEGTYKISDGAGCVIEVDGTTLMYNLLSQQKWDIGVRGIICKQSSDPSCIHDCCLFADAYETVWVERVNPLNRETALDPIQFFDKVAAKLKEGGTSEIKSIKELKKQLKILGFYSVSEDEEASSGQ